MPDGPDRNPCLSQSVAKHSGESLSILYRTSQARPKAQPPQGEYLIADLGLQNCSVVDGDLDVQDNEYNVERRLHRVAPALAGPKSPATPPETSLTPNIVADDAAITVSAYSR